MAEKKKEPKSPLLDKRVIERAVARGTLSKADLDGLLSADAYKALIGH
mgnify:CR=1 FL=1